MSGKQALLDTLVVLFVPFIVGMGFYLWAPSEELALLSLVKPPEEQEFGVQAKSALAALRSITMDGSLFEDPVYKSLQEFHVDIDAAVLGRTYPFTPPNAVRNLSR